MLGRIGIVGARLERTLAGLGAPAMGGCDGGGALRSRTMSPVFLSNRRDFINTFAMLRSDGTY